MHQRRRTHRPFSGDVGELAVADVGPLSAGPDDRIIGETLHLNETSTATSRFDDHADVAADRNEAEDE